MTQLQGNAQFMFRKFTWATLYIVAVKGKGKGNTENYNFACCFEWV